MGDGKYIIVRVQGGSLRSGKEKRLLEEATTQAEYLKTQFGAHSYKVIAKDFSKMVYLQQPGFLELTIQLLNADNKPLITKDEAQEKILELKKLKEEGLISQTELDDAIAPYKIYGTIRWTQFKLVDCSTSNLIWSATGVDVSEFDLMDALE